MKHVFSLTTTEWTTTKKLACCYLWFNIGKEYVKKIVVKEHASLDIVPQTISKFKYRRYAYMMTN